MEGVYYLLFTNMKSSKYILELTKEEYLDDIYDSTLSHFIDYKIANPDFSVRVEKGEDNKSIIITTLKLEEEVN